MAELTGNIYSTSKSLDGDIINKATEWGLITGTLSDQTDLQTALNAKQNLIDSSNKLPASNVSGLSSVATSGSYNDLINQPTIGNATITIQKNGGTVSDFTLNATENKTINISVPVKTSDIINDSNFPSDANYVHTDNNYTSAEKTKLNGIESGAEVNEIDTIKVNNVTQTPVSKAVNISVPTKVSDITNDLNFSSVSVSSSGTSTSTVQYITVNGVEKKLAGGGGNVNDVKVNGTSVVTNKVANIDLTPYRTASAQDVIDATKQDTLQSGVNIKTINSQSILGEGNIVTDGIFKCTLLNTGVEITQAIANNKFPILSEQVQDVYVNYFYVGTTSDAHYFEFTNNGLAYERNIDIDDTTHSWSERTQKSFEHTSNKVTEINSVIMARTNTHYPSEKAVGNYVDDAVSGLASETWVTNNYQQKLTAGANITITNNVISASQSLGYEEVV